MSTSPALVSSVSDCSITDPDLVQPGRARRAAQIHDFARPRRQRRMQRVIHDVPGHPPRRGVQGHMVFQVQRAEDHPALAVVQFHQRRIGQVKFAFQQRTPAAAVRLLDGRAAHAAPVAPVPAGVRLIAFVPTEVIARSYSG